MKIVYGLLTNNLFCFWNCESVLESRPALLVWLPAIAVAASLDAPPIQLHFAGRILRVPHRAVHQPHTNLVQPPQHVSKVIGIIMGMAAVLHSEASERSTMPLSWGTAAIYGVLPKLQGWL